jgi:hypothetical protein
MCAMILVKAAGARPHPTVLTVGAACLEGRGPSRFVEGTNYGVFAREQAGTQDPMGGSRLHVRIPGDDLLTNADRRMDRGEVTTFSASEPPSTDE